MVPNHLCFLLYLPFPIQMSRFFKKNLWHAQSQWLLVCWYHAKLRLKINNIISMVETWKNHCSKSKSRMSSLSAKENSSTVCLYLIIYVLSKAERRKHILSCHNHFVSHTITLVIDILTKTWWHIFARDDHFN